MTSSNMKSLKDMVANMQVGKHEPQQKIVVDEFAKNIINKVFRELSLIFPAWKHNWRSDDPANPDKILSAAKQQWTKAFVENNISTVEQISAGFAKARQADTDFLPSPGKFISWCKPSPEDMGWPSSDECLRECVKFRNNQKLFGDKSAYCRPLFIELTKKIDWWLMNGTDQKKANAHFKEEYIKLLTSGYVEPQASEDLRLPTQEAVKAGMSKEQIEDKKQRDLERIAAIKAKFKGAKR